MATVRDILDVLERMAPFRHALPTDRIGLQVGDSRSLVTRGVVALDRSLTAISFTRELAAEILVTHHPLLFSPIGTVDPVQYEGEAIYELIRAGIACVAAHTNWDAARGGINDELASRLGLSDVKAIGIAADVASLKLVFFCPSEAAERVIDAVSAAGAGQIGSYSRCAFLSRGTGTFVGDLSTHPAIGKPGARESVDEVRVETIVYAGQVGHIVDTLRKAHPYEEPAFDLIPLRPTKEMPLARIGRLASPTTLGEFVATVDRELGTRSLAWGHASKTIRTVAVCGGAADDEWRTAQKEGADVLVTGEVKQHHALEASERGMCLIAAGHYATEHPGCEALRDRLAKKMPEIEWTVFVPKPGLAGRPFSAT